MKIPQVPPPQPGSLIGYGWLYALHARSAIARGRPWQAIYMLNWMREQVLNLACVRLGLPASEARGFDLLPTEITDPLEAAIPGSLEVDDLVSAFAATADSLIREVRAVDESLAGRLGPVVGVIVQSVR